MVSSEDKDFSEQIKKYALFAGFDLCGIAPSRHLKDHEQVLRRWVAQGMNSEMDFITQNLKKRADPGLLLSGAKSVIVVGLNYFTAVSQGGNGIPLVSRYAYGRDYHRVIKEKLKGLFEFIISVKPDVKGKIFVDSAPILEKAWAREAGLGWIGRHSVLINETMGSFIFLGGILTDVDLQYDRPYTKDRCGKCRLCIEACPTKAINESKTIDAGKCISWLTVENKKAIPVEFRGKMNSRIFGCDICQDVCPWNNNASQHNNPDFTISAELKDMTREDWLSLSKEHYLQLFKRSSVRRIKFEQLRRNIRFVSQS